jgi:hypothetical protein
MYVTKSKVGGSWGLAIILLASSLQVTLYAQRAANLSPKVIAAISEPVLDLKDDDPPLVRLKKERFNAALNEAKARLDLYNRGLTRIPALIEVGERLFAAEADLYDEPEKKAEALQRQLDIYTDAENDLEKQVKNGFATQADLERLRYDRLSVQINLFKAKNPSAK